MKGFLLSLFYLSFVFAGKRKSGETKYKILYQSTVSDCADFSNEAVKAGGLALNDEENSLEGTISVGTQLADGVHLTVEIRKYNGDELEILGTVKMQLCDALKESDAPWAPVFEAMGIEECPIDPADFTVNKLVLNTDFAKDFLNNEYVADYDVTLTMSRIAADPKEGEVTLVCYSLPLSIIEYKDEGGDDEE